MSADDGAGPDEWERDQAESEFAELLRTLRRDVPAVQAALFVDEEGECIDYASALEPFEAKVLGAHMHGLQRQVEANGVLERAGGCHFGLEVVTGDFELWVRRISADYALVLRALSGVDRVQLRVAVERTCLAFRRAVGIESPPWEPPAAPLQVRVREAVGWDYAPASFEEDGERVAVTDVLGRWTEPPGCDDGQVCFRVRTAEGRELTLVHDSAVDAWQIRP